MSSEINIKVNGQAATAHRGDTVLAFLVAGGHKTLKKSRQLGEPRGPLCGMGVCYECQVSINGEPNQRACMTQVEDGMVILTDES